MPRRTPDADQPRLFNDSPRERALDVVQPAAAPESRRCGCRALHPRLRLGTSSWSFPGWAGLVYARDHTESDLARHGLAAYSEHPLFRTVGLDRAFYAPLSVEEYRRLAEQTPDGFRFLIKAHQAVTRPHADAGGRTFGDTAALAEGGRTNALFLDADYATDRVVGPATVGLKEKAGPIVFQFPPMSLRGRNAVMAGAAMIDRIGAFLSRLPRPGTDRWGGPRYVIEVRSPKLIDRDHVSAYASMLRGHGAAHGWVVHPAMPTLEEQAAALSGVGFGPEAQPVCSLRWLLMRGLSYDGARDRYAPFSRIVDPDEPTLGEILRLVEQALAAERDTFVIVNNKAEGSGPLTIERIAQRLRREAGGA